MKKLLTSIVLFMIMLTGTSAFASSSNANNANTFSGTTNQSLTKDELGRIVNRVNEIRSMDRKNLSSAERKNLKNELSAMRKRVSEPGAGVYISGTALILIIILLIILL
jgi:DNA gyrase/topoisomerase IV subunit B